MNIPSPTVIAPTLPPTLVRRLMSHSVDSFDYVADEVGLPERVHGLISYEFLPAWNGYGHCRMPPKRERQRVDRWYSDSPSRVTTCIYISLWCL